MSGHVVIAVLSEAKREFGAPSGWDQPRVALWVRRRVREISEGARPPAEVHPFPFRGFEREPGEDDE